MTNRGPTPAGRRAGLALLALALLAVAPAAGAAGGWTEKHVAAIDARMMVHTKLRVLPLRQSGKPFRTVAYWAWPHAHTVLVSIEVAPLAEDKPIASLLEEMDGQPRREPRDDGLPAIRTETLFEGTLERHFWVHDRARGRVVRISIYIFSVDRWMERKIGDIRKEFADPLWVATKMFRSLRFDPR